MLPSLKAAFTLLSLLQLISSVPVTPRPTLQPQKILKEVIHLIQKDFSGVQVNAATPLSFALLSDLIINDDDDDDDVLQCSRPGTGTATTETGACLGGRSPSHWLNPFHPIYFLGHPGPFQPRLCVISTRLGGTSSSWGRVRQSFPPDVRYFAEKSAEEQENLLCQGDRDSSGTWTWWSGQCELPGDPCSTPTEHTGILLHFPKHLLCKCRSCVQEPVWKQ